MNNTATNLNTATKTVTKSDIRSQFPSAEVTQQNNRTDVKFTGLVARFGCWTEELPITVSLPHSFLPGLRGDQPWWPLTKADMLIRPYGSEFSDRFGRIVLHEKHGAFGIVPVSYHYRDNSELYLGVEYNPLAAGAIIVYSGSPMVMSYASTHRRVAFQLGDTGLYGVILPFNYLVDVTNVFKGYHESEHSLRHMMSRHLDEHLRLFAGKVAV